MQGVGPVKISEDIFTEANEDPIFTGDLVSRLGLVRTFGTGTR
jgi:hypothetical protein